MWITILHIQVLKSWVLKKQFYMTHTHTHTKQPKQERTNSKKIHCPFSVSTSYLCFSNPGDSRSRRLRTSMEVKDAVAVPSSRKKPHVIFGQFDTKHQKKTFHDHLSSCSTSTAVESTSIKVHELYWVLILCDIHWFDTNSFPSNLWPSWSSDLTNIIDQDPHPWRNQIHRSERWINKEPW